VRSRKNIQRRTELFAKEQVYQCPNVKQASGSVGGQYYINAKTPAKKNFKCWMMFYVILTFNFPGKLSSAKISNCIKMQMDNMQTSYDRIPIQIPFRIPTRVPTRLDSNVSSLMHVALSCRYLKKISSQMYFAQRGADILPFHKVCKIGLQKSAVYTANHSYIMSASGGQSTKLKNSELRYWGICASYLLTTFNMVESY
jgi:hypothetical protein